jgi:hypothetical protein
VLKIIREILSLAIELFHVTGCLIKKHPVPTKRASVRLIKVKSCDELLHMLLMCVAAVCLRSVTRFFFYFGYLSSGHYIYVREDVRIHGYFSKPSGVREQKRLRNTDVDVINGFIHFCFFGGWWWY